MAKWHLVAASVTLGLVAGILMVDPIPKNSEYPAKIWDKIIKMKEIANRLSSKAMYAKYGYENAKKLKNISAELFYHMLGFEQSKKQIQQLPTLSNKIPIIILSSTFMERHNQMKIGDWYQSQRQWLNNNPHSEIIKVHSGHFIHQDHPVLVCEQIKKLVTLFNK